jgi:hypothetical protein
MSPTTSNRHADLCARGDHAWCETGPAEAPYEVCDDCGALKDAVGSGIATKAPAHTRTPWHTGGRDNNVIYPESGYAIANAMTYHGHSDDTANAAFIVRACNSHDTLVDALRWVVEHCDCEKRGHKIVAEELRHVVRAALAAAGEQP